MRRDEVETMNTKPMDSLLACIGGPASMDVRAWAHVLFSEQYSYLEEVFGGNAVEWKESRKIFENNAMCLLAAYISKPHHFNAHVS